MDEEKFKNLLEEEIEKFAIIVGKGFEEIHKKMATKEDITDVQVRLDGIDNRLDGIDNRLIKIENMHEQRLERVEDRVQVLETRVGVHR